jgi:hypothetical protein
MTPGKRQMVDDCSTCSVPPWPPHAFNMPGVAVTLCSALIKHRMHGAAPPGKVEKLEKCQVNGVHAAVHSPLCSDLQASS